jgi:hypothetical protein
MQAYRCYFLNTLGSIERVEVIEAGSDAEAIKRARTKFLLRDASYGGFEIWEKARRVHLETAGPSERIRRWRMKADELRAAAETVAHGPARRGFLSSAETYDSLADAAEARVQRHDRESDVG